jgi:hypothetical protein
VRPCAVVRVIEQKMTNALCFSVYAAVDRGGDLEAGRCCEQIKAPTRNRRSGVLVWVDGMNGLGSYRAELSTPPR